MMQTDITWQGTPRMYRVALSVIQPLIVLNTQWHPTQDEWGFYLYVLMNLCFVSDINSSSREGFGRMTVFASSGNAQTYNFEVRELKLCLLSDY